jgi:hypothetical protein
MSLCRAPYGSHDQMFHCCCFRAITWQRLFLFLKDPIYLQSVIIHSANGGKGEGWHVEEYSVALLC